MKTPAQRPLVALELEIGLEARYLAAVGVPLDGDVDETEVLAVEHDHPGARPQDGPLEPAQRLVQPVEPHQTHERGRFATRHDRARPAPPAPRACGSRLRRRRAGAASARARESFPVPPEPRSSRGQSYRGVSAPSRRSGSPAAMPRFFKPRATSRNPTNANTAYGTQSRDVRDPCDRRRPAPTTPSRSDTPARKRPIVASTAQLERRVP